MEANGDDYDLYSVVEPADYDEDAAGLSENSPLFVQLVNGTTTPPNATTTIIFQDQSDIATSTPIYVHAMTAGDVLIATFLFFIFILEFGKIVYKASV